MAQPMAVPPAGKIGEVVRPSARSLRETRRRQIRLVALAIPLIVFLIIVYGWPIIGFLSRSFLDPTLTAKHWQDVTSSSAAIRIVLITFRIATTVTLSCLVLGYPVAYLLSSINSRVGNLLMILVLVPFWTSILVRTYSWMVILGNSGLINNILTGLHLISAPLPLLFNSFSVHVGMIHILLPFMILTLYSVMRGIDRNLLRAAQNLGASPWSAFWRIFVPLSLPGVFSGCVLVFILALGFYITPQLLGGPTDYMVSMFMYVQVTELLDWGYAALLALILLVVTVVIFALFSRFMKLDRIYGGRS